MMVPYVLRLLCICLAAFFLVNAVIGLLVSIASRAAIRISETMRPRFAARFLLFLRLLPTALGLTTVLALCIPSYLWLEPESTPERVGWKCLALVVLAVATLAAGLMRGGHALVVSLRFHWTWQQAGRLAHLPGDHSNAVIVEKEAPLLALAGVLQPRLFISDGVLRALTPEELEVALQHENAHRVSCDNLKRLLLALTPNSSPFFAGFSLLEQTWVKLSEWAADDEAVEGDSNRALSLAAALLCVARMGAPAPLSFLHTSLAACDGDLSARVNRLLRIEAVLTKPSSPKPSLAIGAGLGMAVCIFAVMAWPASLSPVHRLLEMFLR
jgi:Zn-dependent protease with chaperone function